MKQPQILALILAGGEGGRMELLTEQRAKPVIPFAGTYRLIDIPLSHCVHSQIEHVWVIEQFQPHTLNDHLANGRPWDLDRTYGGLRILPPYTGSEAPGFAKGNADALYRNLPFIREFNPDLLLVLSADHVYKLDYRDVIAAHLDTKADVTMVTTERPIDQVSRHGVVQANKRNRVIDFAYKPEQPKTNVVTAEIFVYSVPPLIKALENLVKEHGEDGLEDYGDTLIPYFVEAGTAYAFALEGYWRDVGTVDAYWEANMDWLADTPPLALDAPDWPIYTYMVPRLAAHIHAEAKLANSLIAPGCQIYGTVERSILGPGVVVEAGAVIRDSIVFERARIGADATIDHAIIDSEAQIGTGATVGAAPQRNKRKLTLVGQRARVAARRTIEAGEQIRASKQQVTQKEQEKP